MLAVDSNLSPPVISEILAYSQEQGIQTILEPISNEKLERIIAFKHNDQASSLLYSFDTIKLNEHQFELMLDMLSGSSEVDWPSKVAKAKQLLVKAQGADNKRLTTVIVTRGSEGVYFMQMYGDKIIEINQNAPCVDKETFKLVSSIGAGDSFLGGYLFKEWQRLMTNSVVSNEAKLRAQIEQ